MYLDILCVFKFGLNIIPMAVAGVQVKSHEKSCYACDVNPFCLSPILRLPLFFFLGWVLPIVLFGHPGFLYAEGVSQ